MIKGISILICTYNGADKLPETLAHLSAQATSAHLNWEIILIDNDSTDNSAQISLAEWAKYKITNINFRVVTESNPGKLNALETGIYNANYEYFIICDDDNWLAPNYVQAAFDRIEKNPLIGALGGQSHAVINSGSYPSWFSKYNGQYAVGEQGNEMGDVTSRGYLWGAGLVSRTALYKQAYKNFTSLMTDNNGRLLPAGEDNEYCQRLILMGYKLYYDPELVLEHFITAERLGTTYRDRLLRRIEDSEKILSKYRVITKIKVNLAQHRANRLRLLLITPIRALSSFLSKKDKHHMNMMRYLLNLDFKADPVLNAIRAFEQQASSYKSLK